VTALDHLLLNRVEVRQTKHAVGTTVDPVLLEVFNNLFMNIAEQMGLQLQNTAHSVNIKERLDFSCALFDTGGNLIANAPHMPVHLGSMGESIKTVIRENAGNMHPGDVFVLNDPYHGGTHLPHLSSPKADSLGHGVGLLDARAGLDTQLVGGCAHAGCRRLGRRHVVGAHECFVATPWPQPDGGGALYCCSKFQ
jgi:hypothetical protein